jgi:hypothetical protein
MRILKVPVLVSKQYISIIRLFQHCDIATDHVFNLSRAKKQLQAEFNTAGDGFIQADGYSYARHETFEEIERPDFSQRLVYHQMIWKSPSVLQLLEKNNADFIEIRKEFNQFWDDEVFDHFFSPYFCGPFAYVSRSLLAELNFAGLAELFCYEGFLEPEEREVAFKPVRVFLSDAIRTLRNVNDENYKIMRPKIAFWVDKDWHPFFNRLPHEFYDTKNSIVVILINLGVALQKTHRRDCRKISAQLVSLEDLPENLLNTILSNHAIYNKSRFRLKHGWWLAWMIYAMVRILFSGSCN